MEEKHADKLKILKQAIVERKENSKSKEWDIDADILFNPKHPDFHDKYCLERPEEENLLMAIKLRAYTRNFYMLGAFTSYHVVKTGLWKYGYGATFFYKTRLMTIPLLAAGLVYSNCKKYPRDLMDAGIAEYSVKKFKFTQDCAKVKEML